MKQILKWLAFIWSAIYSQRISNKFQIAKNVMYSKWFEREFKAVGDGFFIERPLYLLGGDCITIGENFSAHRGLRVETYSEHNGVKFTPNLTIGDNVYLNFDCHIGCVDKVTIGNNVLIASRVFITDHFHGTTNSREELHIPPRLRILSTKGEVKIEDDVWLGEGVAIMPGVTIGKGAVIGTNSVVTKNIPAYAIAAGIPARVIKQL